MFKVGDKIPSAHFPVFTGTDFKDVDIAELVKGKKAVLFSVPGAFTPVCNKHMSSFSDQVKNILAKGVDIVLCVAVNDPFVLRGWAEQNKVIDDIVMLSDWKGEFTKAVGADFDQSAAFMGRRSKRYNAILEDGIVTHLNVEGNPGECIATNAYNLLEHL